MLRLAANVLHHEIWRDRTRRQLGVGWARGRQQEEQKQDSLHHVGLKMSDSVKTYLVEQN
jgi:hypothetical protein